MILDLFMEYSQLFHYILTSQPTCLRLHSSHFIYSLYNTNTLTCGHGVGGRKAFLPGLSRREEVGRGDPHTGGGQDLVHWLRS